MQTPDYIVFFIYFIIVSTYGWYVYKRKKHEDSKDYFVMYFISMYENRNGIIPNGLQVDKSMFRTSPSFTVGALIIIGIIVALYSVY
ncbi:MAG: hypothetical protein WKF68_01340 [Daejeonella sp.]